MSRAFTGRIWRVFAIVLLAAFVGGCGLFGRGGKDTTKAVHPSNIPTAFDVTVLSEKDTQFELDGVPLTADDLRGALIYRKTEEHKSIETILIKRGEKQKVTKEHLAGITKIAIALGATAFFDDKGEISELQAR